MDSQTNRPTSQAVRQARLVCAAIAATAVFMLATLASQSVGAPRRGGEGDIGLFRATVERVRGGEAYYAVMADEMPRRGYPTASVFNWRSPLPLWLIGRLPSGVAKSGLIAIAAATLLLAYRMMQQETSRPTAALCVLLMIGALLPCVVGDLFVMPVVWSGALIALSLVALAAGHEKTGLVAGIAALLVRDLALVYVVASAGLAFWERRWRELAGWMAGLALWAVYYGWHIALALEHQPASPVAHDAGWIQLGGAAFLIGICQMNLFLLVRPAWLAALYLVAVLFGGWGWQSDWGRRATLITLAYLLTFAVVGQPFNQYWGSLVAPLFCLTAARFPTVLARLQKQIAIQSSQPATA